MLSGKNHSRNHADKCVGDDEQQDELQDFGVNHDGVSGVFPHLAYHIRNAGPAARIIPEDQAVGEQVAGHADYSAAEDEKQAHEENRRAENIQPDQAVIQAENAKEDHTDSVKPHTVGKHLVKGGNGPGENAVKASVKNHVGHLPDPFKQDAAKPFRNIKKGHDQINFILLPAGNGLDIAADDEGHRHAEEPGDYAGEQHEPEIQRVFHFRFYVLFLQF